MLKVLAARSSNGFDFRGESLLLYRRLWKLLFDNIELLIKLQALVREIFAKATNKVESMLKMKAALIAIGLEEKSCIREQLKQRLRFYASAYEIQYVAS